MKSPIWTHSNEARAWSWTRLTGPDASDFLHRLTTVNVVELQIGQGSPGCFLTPQGKVLISFQLWRGSEDSFAFEYEAGISRHWEQALLDTIEHYRFGEKMELTSHPELRSVWLFPANDDHWPGPQQTTDLGSVRLCRQPDEAFGRVWITAWGKAAELESWLSQNHGNAPALSAEELERARVLQLWPRPDFEITKDTLPLETGMRKFIADGKGCYPGQEVIEKIISLGSPARRLVLLECDAAPAPGTLVRPESSSSEVGRITSSLPGFPGRALALMRKTHIEAGLRLGFINVGGQATVFSVAPYQ